MYRGLNVDAKEFRMQITQGSRWTAFTSVTSNPMVAQKFGIVHKIAVDKSTLIFYDNYEWPVERVFDISTLSAFPEESELLILPGVRLASWGMSCAIWTSRSCKMKEWKDKVENMDINQNKRRDCIILQLPMLLVLNYFICCCFVSCNLCH